MSSVSKRTTVGGILTLLLTATAPAAPVLARVLSPCERLIAVAEVHARTLLPCDPGASLVQWGDLRVGVPAPGHYAQASSISPTGGAQLLVLRFHDGSLHAGTDPSALLEANGAMLPTAVALYPPGVPDPDQPSCYESDYGHVPYKRTSQTYEWIYDPGIEFEPITHIGEPYPNVISDILAGAANMSTGVNPCLLPPIPGLIQQQVAYNPAAEGLFTMAGDCDNDPKSGNNIVDWGYLPSALATTCVSGYISFLGIRLQPIETDIRFNWEIPWLTPAEQALLLHADPQKRTCPRHAYDVQSTAAHEFGHVWGLDDITTGEHQTMYASGRVCDLSSRDLGYGDWHGLASKYPLAPGP